MTSTTPDARLGRWVRRASLGCLAASGAVAAWYLTAGHAFVTGVVAENRRAIRRALLAGDGPFTLADYVAAADGLVVASVVVGLVLSAALAAWPVSDRPMARVYARAMGALDWCLARRRMCAVLGGAAVFAGVSLIALGVLQDFPNSGDEYCYLYQAGTFARGHVANTPHPQQEFFTFFHVRQVDNRVFSVFPPGWPAVLAAATVLRVPLWVVNPLLGVAALWLTFLVGRRRYDDLSAAAGVAVLAVTPFFLFNAASYFAHALCAVQILAFAYFGLRAIDERRAAWAAAAAAAIGTALLTRNYTAVWCVLPFALALLRMQRFGLRALGAAGLAGLPFALAFLDYNTATMGHPFAMAMSGFEAYDDRWFPPNWFGRGIEITAGHLGRFLRWTPPALLVLYGWSLRRGSPAAGWRFTDGIFPALALGYFFYVERGGNQYGPRYYFEGLPFVVLAVAAAVTKEPRYEDKPPGARLACYALVLSLAACVPLLAMSAATEGRVVSERREPYRLAAEQRLDHAIVFVATSAGWTRPMSALDLTRNDPAFTARVLYAHDLGPRNAELMAAYPDRAFYRYRFDRATRRGSLDALPSMLR